NLLCSLQQCLRGHDVVVRVDRERAAPARPDTGLAGQVVDDLDAVEQLGRRRVAQIGLHEREPVRAAEPSDARPLDGWVVVIAEPIDAQDLKAVLDEALAQMRAYETGRTGHEDSLPASRAGHVPS